MLAASLDLAEVAAAALAAPGVCLNSCGGGVSGLATATGSAQGADDSGCAVGVPAASRDLAEVAAAHSGGLISNVFSPAFIHSFSSERPPRQGAKLLSCCKVPAAYACCI